MSAALQRAGGARMRGLGILLLCVGTVLALLGAARLEGEGKAIRSAPHLPLLSSGLATLCVALGLLRAPRRAGRQVQAGEDQTQDLCGRIHAALRSIARGEAALLSRGDSASSQPLGMEVLTEGGAPDPEEPAYLLWLKVQLDPIADDLFPALFSGRDRFRDRAGVAAYVSLFSGLSRAERLTLRAWSAAVDGYGDEARSALADAEAQMAACAAELRGEKPAP